MIHIICALHCEAQPLIKHFQLHCCAHAPSFPTYMDRDKHISLTISGIGKINAAAATAFTYIFLQSTDQHIWLNVGIAGHGQLAIGELVLGHKIVDQATQQTWYPQFINLPSSYRTTEIFTYDRPCTDYQAVTVEMEAAGFYATASRFTSSEFIHVLKVITDNQDQPITKIVATMVSNLLQQKLLLIEQLMHSLTSLAQCRDDVVPIATHYDQILAQWHFTHTQRNRLKACLRRWLVLCPSADPFASLKQAKDGQDALNILTDQLDHYPLNLNS